MSNISQFTVPSSDEISKDPTGSDVENLQRYLQHYGYLRILKFKQGLPAFLAAECLPEAEFGVFDAQTKLALKGFQQFHGLNPDGELNQETVEQMGKKRCDVADFATQEQVDAFLAQGNKWDRTNLTYGFQEFTPDLSPQQVRDAIAAALNLWSHVTPLTFTEIPLSSNPDFIIRFVAGDHGDGHPFDGVYGTLAHAFYPPPNWGDIAGDAHFDEAETWTVNLPTPTGACDLITIAAHEFGHSLGLAHSSVQGALMFPEYSGPHRYLHQDDIDGIRSIYGAGMSDWESLGGQFASSPSACSLTAGRLDVFVQGADNTLMHKWFDGGWSAWESLGGVLTSAPSAASWGNSRIDVFARGADNALWHKWFDGSWSAWESLGGVLTSAPSAVYWDNGRLDVFVRGTDNTLMHKWFDGGWSAWESLGGVLTSAPSAVHWGNGRLDIFVQGTDNTLMHKWFDGTWSAWESLGGVLTSGPGACSWGEGRLDVFVRGANNALYHKWFDGAWSAWEYLSGVLASAPSAVSWGEGRLDVFVQSTDNALYHRWFDGGWSGW